MAIDAGTGRICWGLNLNTHTLHLSINQSQDTPNLWRQDINNLKENPPWLRYSVTSSKIINYVNIHDIIKPFSLYKWFYWEVDRYVEFSIRYDGFINNCITNIDTSECLDMSYFYGASDVTQSSVPRLGTLNLSTFNTSKVTDMSHMFEYSYLSSIILSDQFNTSNVTDMSYMFSHATNFKLGLFDLTVFDTAKVTDMSHMFEYIQDSDNPIVDLSSFDISNVTNMDSMFYYCLDLETIYVKPNTDWSISPASSTNMFYYCRSLVGGNGTAHGTSETTTNNNKTRARIDKTGQQGYFTIARRTLSKNITGNGTVTGDGEYDYGSTVTVVVTPDINNYIDSVSKIIAQSETVVYDTDSVNAYRFSLALTKNTSIEAVFGYRDEHTITIVDSGGHDVKGAGTYRYLDVPTLIVDLGGGLIPFDGWYNGDVKLSSQNPYTFTMPDNDLSLSVIVGDVPFSDMEVRQFILQNSFGELYVLNSKDSAIYFNDPEGLGFEKQIETTRLGNSETVDSEQYEMPQIKGVLKFRGNTIEQKYQTYHDFVRFISRKPIMLWYKIPVNGTENIYHIPVEVLSVEKSEVTIENTLKCSIEMYATGFWSHSDITVERTMENIGIINDSDFDMGIDITVYRSDGLEFANPVITFSQNEVVYGICALYSYAGQTFDKIRINTNDSQQSIKCYLNDAEIDNPFGYIDFEYSDGKKQFPFPKLKQGLTTISFTYDGASSEDRIYLVTYDKEYLSV